MNMAKWGKNLFILISTAIFVNGYAWSAPPDTSPQGFAWKDSAEIYAKICAYCHEAQVAPPIRNRSLPPEYIRAVVRNGNRAMPAFRASVIDDESLAKLADFVSKSEMGY